MVSPLPSGTAGCPDDTAGAVSRSSPKTAGPRSHSSSGVSNHSSVESWLTGTRGRRERGGTFVGILLGIVIGLAIAVATALLVTRTTLPFVGSAAKADKSGAAATAPATAAVPDAPKPQVAVAPGDVPDPNRSAASRQRPAPGQPPVERREVATVTAPPATPSQQVLPPAGVAPAIVAGATASAPIRMATPTAPPSAPAPQAAVASTERGATYLLQAGAFRGPDDADAMKLRLALMGLEAQIVTADVNGTTLHRVRVGPYDGLDAMNRARARLAENGVEATVLRQR